MTPSKWILAGVAGTVAGWLSKLVGWLDWQQASVFGLVVLILVVIGFVRNDLRDRP